MPIYNSILYSDNYSKSLWQYYRDETALDANETIADFPANNNNNSILFKGESRPKLHPCYHVRFLLIVWRKSIVQSFVAF